MKNDRLINKDSALGDTTLDALYKEVIEARNLAIKTDNLVKNLGAEIKQVARRQEAHQRKNLFNSAVAYVLFVALIFTGLYLAFDAKISAAREEVVHFTARNESLRGRLEDVEGELERRREAEDRAYQFFELLENGNRDEVVEQFTEVQAQIIDRAMIELLRDRVDEITYSLAEESYREGMQYIRQDNWSDARDAFQNSLNHRERTPWEPELNYYLAVALYNLEDYEGALHFFDLALASEELDESNQAYARYRRGEALQSIGSYEAAIEAYQQYREFHPNHRYSGRALREINDLQRDLSATDDE